jgi:hypothetical protein
MTEHPDRIERTLELLLYAPLGVGLFLKESAPAFVDMFVSRGRAEIDRRHEDVQQRVTTARSLGQVALAFGPPIVRERVERTVADARQRAEGLFGAPASAPGPTRVEAAPPAPEPPASTPPAPTPSPGPMQYAPPPVPPSPIAPGHPVSSNGGGDAGAELPIPGYDALSASQVVERLLGLSVVELQAVHAYETAHRQRRTILGKIEQLIG